MAGTKTGISATPSVSAQKLHSPNDCQMTWKRKLCSFTTSSYKPGNELNTLCLASSTWTRHRHTWNSPHHVPSSSLAAEQFCQDLMSKKRSFAVALAVVADGTKLLPRMIFKGVQHSRDLIVLNSLHVPFHKKGWMDESGVKEGIPQYLLKTRNHKQSLLVWDSFGAHLTVDVKAALKQWKSMSMVA